MFKMILEDEYESLSELDLISVNGGNNGGGCTGGGAGKVANGDTGSGSGGENPTAPTNTPSGGGGGGGSTTISSGGCVAPVYTDTETKTTETEDKSNETINKSEEKVLAKVSEWGIAFPLGLEWSNDFKMTSGFSDDREPIETPGGVTGVGHAGIDFAASLGTRINSVGDGYVSDVGYNPSLGNFVVIKHENGTSTRYAHCNEVSAIKGMAVQAGEQIATVGNTGMSRGPHLHFSYDGNGDGKYSTNSCDNPSKALGF